MVQSNSPQVTTQTLSASVKYKPGRNPRSLANLKPYKPGQNGNPKPGNSLTARLKNALLEPFKVPSLDASVGDHIVYSTLKGAYEREVAPFHEVWDRTEGKVPDKHAILGKVIFEVVHVEKRKDYLDEFSEISEGKE